MRRTGISVLLGCVVLAGCGADESVSVQRSNGTVLLVSGSDSGGGDAKIMGTLARTQQGCLGVLTEDAEQATAAVWPKGATMSDDGQIVLMDGGRALTVGDPVNAGGGEVNAPFPERFSEVPKECMADGPLLDIVSVS